MVVALDLVGHLFGKLTVTRLGPHNGKKRRWWCSCDCGAEVLAGQDALRNGAHVSCGCGRNTHGMSRSRVYHIWQGMIRRCTKPTQQSWPEYGGRGITVCDEWLSFERFLADMGEPPTPRHTLEREKNDEGYRPGNCRWATPIEQSQNTRRNVLVEFNGQTKSISAWARERGLLRETLRRRLAAGWPIERAMSPTAR